MNGSGAGGSSTGGTTTGGGSGSGSDGLNGSGAGGSSTGGTTTGGGSGSSSAAVTARERISVTLIKQPTVAVTGAIVVEVVSELVKSPVGFSFQLPKSLIDIVALTKTQPSASLVTGEPLPAWLTFVPASNTFLARNVPNDGLPIQVIVTIGNTRTVLVVSERNG